MILSCYQLACHIAEMPHAYLPTIGATLIALFSMTALAETLPLGASGIEGVVLVSPSRPGPIRKDEGPTVAPVRNAQFAIKAGDATVKTFTTDGEGRFQVALPPGHYVIVREGAPPRIGRWRFEADVVAGQVTKVNWTADSGMR
jgi:Prealbumin-like fold domain